MVVSRNELIQQLATFGRHQISQAGACNTPGHDPDAPNIANVYSSAVTAVEHCLNGWPVSLMLPTPGKGVHSVLGGNLLDLRSMLVLFGNSITMPYDEAFEGKARLTQKVLAAKGPATEVARGPSAQSLLHLSLFPLVLMTWLEGKSLGPFLAEVTGLSTSRFRHGRSLQLRESTLLNVRANAEKRTRESVLNGGGSEEQVAEYFTSAPSARANQPRPYADFIYALETAGSVKLPLTITFAEEIDCLANSISLAYQSNDLASFKHAITGCNWGEGVHRPIAEEEAERRFAALNAASNWDEAFAELGGFTDNVFICLLAALDAEHGSTFFGHFQPRPLFLLVAPKLNPAFDPNALDKAPRRNLVYRPVRRLLELSHALMFWAKHQRWPAKPIGRKALSEALGLDDRSVGNLFDGTRNLNATLFNSLWHCMSKSVVKAEPFAAPLPLVLAAICWQNGLINLHPNQKLRSVTVLNDANYTRYWTWHRQRWASQLYQGTEGWPTWLDDQLSVSPDSEA